MPNFDLLYKNFEANLDKNRRNKRTTKTIPFKFQETNVLLYLLYYLKFIQEKRKKRIS